MSLQSICFVSYHQRPASGGVYSIQKIACELAKRGVRVHLLITSPKDELQPLDGVVVTKSTTLAEDQVPDSDAIVLHADSLLCEEFAGLDASKGKKFLYLQGYDTPGSRHVLNNLEKGHAVLASSRWLVEDARQYTRDVHYTPYGLDRSLFHHRSLARRPQLVTMMTHPVESKGTGDGLAALERVRRERPETEILLFGKHNCGFPADFVYCPSLKKVGQIFRRSTIFVVPSWLEGFGMPGLEAQACGAALVTTDTKGCRDYAEHKNTALVSEPQTPKQLARNIIHLLDNPRFRKNLVREAHRRCRKFGTWKRAAQLFGEAISTSLEGIHVAQ